MFSKERLDYFKSLPRSIKLNLSANQFTKSEILFIIDETPLSERDRMIAIKRYTERMTYEEIAEIVDCDYRSVMRALPSISRKLKKTCAQLFCA